MMKVLTQEQYLEFEKLHLAVFSPLAGFMGQKEYRSVVDHYCLPSGEIFTLPVVLDFTAAEYEKIKAEKKIELFFQEQLIGYFYPQDFYRPDKKSDAFKIFTTIDQSHPGVQDFFSLGEFFAGGGIELIKRVPLEFSKYELTPTETKAYFKKQSWRKVVGFQTRNIPHRAHEYLQKTALEICDGIFIQPLVGKKKKGDFNPQTVIKAYETLTQDFYPTNTYLLGILSTKMRYAGPREALFHALIRKNYGCTHFIIGRDHAGVGHFYSKYQAHELARKFSDKMGIELFLMAGPYFCTTCKGIVTEKTCPHSEDKLSHVDISGTKIRQFLTEDIEIDDRYIRPEIIHAIRSGEIFL